MQLRITKTTAGTVTVVMGDNGPETKEMLQTWLKVYGDAKDVPLVPRKALALIGAVALCTGWYRLRTRRIRRSNVALQEEITERQRAEEESRQNLQQLARVSRAASLGELTTSIAHEIRQPLFAIVSNAQSAKRLLDFDEPDIGEVHEALKDIASDARRASGIVDHIRSLMRRQPQPTEPLDLNRVVLEAIRLVDPEFASRGVSIRSELGADLPRVKGNPIELQQVILNLITNGAQAMRDVEPGSRVLIVTTVAEPDSVELTVEDRGEGLDEERSRHLFEPFYTTRLDGTGFGLAISRTIIEAHGGRIWASANSGRGATFYVRLPTYAGLYERNDKSFVRTAEEELGGSPDVNVDLPSITVHALRADDDGGVWNGSFRGLLHHRDGRFESLHPWGVHDILRTRNGGLYATANIHVARWKDDALEISTSIRENRFVNCVLEEREGVLWFGSHDGLRRLEGDLLTHYGLADGLPGVRVQTIARGRGGSLWIGAFGGLGKWSDGKFSRVDPPRAGELDVMVVYEDSEEVLWMALHGRETYTLQGGDFTRVKELSGGWTHWFHEDASGDLWIGHDTGPFRFSAGHVERVSDPALDRLGSLQSRCHYAADDGSLWIGTRGGLARYRFGRFDVFTSKDGLPIEDIERMHADSLGNLWLGNRNGFFFVSLEELDDVAAGRRQRVDSHRAEQDYGIARWATPHSFPKACRASDGTLWIASPKGAIKVPPGAFPKNRVPPPVHIEEVRLDGRTVRADEPFELLAGRRRLAIDFSALTFFRPDRVLVKYRLNGHDESWIGAGTERVAYYTDLRPGDYEFQVIADNGDGVWNEEGQSMTFTVNPRWWETIWFQVSALAGAVALGVAYFRSRVRRVRRMNTALRREISERKRAEEESRRHREQLARVSRASSMGELITSIAHEIKQPLFAIVSNAQSAERFLSRDKPNIEEVYEALDDIASDGQRASAIIDHTRALVRKEPRPTEPLDLNEVARQVIRLADPRVAEMGGSTKTDLAEDLPKVQGNAIELQQVIFNLIMNGAQAMSDVDSGSRELKVVTLTSGDSVELTVEDRGGGLDEEQARRMFEPFFTTKPQGTGMGLAINRTIIEAHDGRIWATSNSGAGATFHVSLPISRESAS